MSSGSRGVQEVSAAEAASMIEKDPSLVVLDVRTKQEFDSPGGHLKGAILIPVQELQARTAELDRYKDRTIIAVCRSGNRSGVATGYLNSVGFKVLNLTGGMIEWRAMGLPVEREAEKEGGRGQTSGG